MTYRGYVKVWRKAVESGWLKNHKLWAFWSWCLLKATHMEYKTLIGYQEITLIPGQFIFGRKSAAKELCMTEQIIRTCMQKLKDMQNITIKTTNKFSVITIVNWDIYQGNGEEDNQQDNQQLTNKEPTTNQQLTTNKNNKNNKNVKNDKKLFIVPSLEEVSVYCQQRKNNIDPETFIAHYTTNGWMVGKNKMKDWKAAIITWEKRRATENYSTPPTKPDSFDELLDRMK